VLTSTRRPEDLSIRSTRSRISSAVRIVVVSSLQPRLATKTRQRAQDELIEARNRLAHAIAGAAMSGLTRDEIVELTGYPADRIVRICTDAGISGTETHSAQDTPTPHKTPA
jgi:hypothetical protein